MSKKAFTLIEMLLVAALLSVTGLAVYNAISDGLRVWEYSRRFSAEEDVAVFFEKITIDLQNTRRYSKISFEGSKDKLTIPTVVRTPIDKKISPPKEPSAGGEIIEQIGAAEYFMDKSAKAISRQQGNYSQALKKKFSAARILAKPVESMHFTYYVVEEGKLKSKKTISGEIPASVLVEIDFVEVTGSMRHVRQMITIPVRN